MKICIFTENHYRGGLDTFLVNLINAWPDDSDRLTLMCNVTHPGLVTIRNKVSRRLTITTYRRLLSSSVVAGQGVSRICRFVLVRAVILLSCRILKYPILFPWYILSLWRSFNEADYDSLLVVNGGYPASMLCRCAIIAWGIAGSKNKAVMNIHNYASKPRMLFRYIENLIDGLVIKYSSQIVTVSYGCLKSFDNRPKMSVLTRTKVIYNGIQDPRLGTVNSSAQNSVLPYCLMLATYEKRKGHSFLLRAFSEVVEQLPDARLRIYGHGRESEKNRVRTEIGKMMLEQHVEMYDFEPGNSDLISNSSLVVVPSQEFESFGLTIIEAMACAVPVVTTDVGGMPEVLAETGAGFVCSRHSTDEFAKAIITILSDSDLAIRIGSAGRKAYTQRYTAKKMAINYHSLLADGSV